MKPFNYILIATLIAAALLAFTWWVFRRLFRDGVGPTGKWDDEGGIPNSPWPGGGDLTFSQAPFSMRHFRIEEFDSPDLNGSGVNMKVRFLQMIDEAREIAGIAFKVNSGYRTVAHNKNEGGVKNSAHLVGFAADIKATTLEQKIKIVRAARSVGFNRFGIYNTFIHLDCDPGKSSGVAWNKKMQVEKKGGDFSDFPFDPFTI